MTLLAAALPDDLTALHKAHVEDILLPVLVQLIVIMLAARISAAALSPHRSAE